MKILHITKKYRNAIGGDARVVSNLEREQSKFGHEVFILTSNCDQIIKKDNVIKFGLKMNTIDLDKITLRRVINLISLFIYSFYLLKKLKPGIIHSHSADMGFFVSLAARIYKIPILNTCHGVTFAYNPSNLKGKFEKIFLKFGFDAIITVDRTTLKIFLDNGIKPIYYLPNGIHLSVLTEKAKNRENSPVKVLFVGRLEKQKGLEYLLRAVKILAKYEDLKFILYVIGDGSMKKFYKKLSDKNIYFMDKISDKELDNLYRTSDIFVLPSLWEGLPISVLEAWNYKLPVIVTSVGDISHLCKNFKNAIVVEPANTKILADAIKFLICNVAYRKKLGHIGYRQCSKFSWEVINNRLIKIYNLILTSNS